MPRKVNYKLGKDDYDDYYDYYDYEDDDYDPEIENYGEEPELDKNQKTGGIWRCSYCTYDNEEGMNESCNICGFARHPSVNTEAYDSDKNYGASKFSESLFASASPQPMPKEDNFAESKLSKDVTVDKEITSGNLPSSSTKGDCKIKSSNDVSPQNSSEDLTVDVRTEKSDNIMSKAPHQQIPYKLSGRLLHLSGRVTKKEMYEYEKESKLQRKGSFAYAWALNESSEERERGITMTVAVAYLDTKKYHVVVLDSPGHKDFVPNMIYGATQADAVILVIDASVGAYEAGMDSGKGQTREHAQLMRSFGVDQVIVAINKMDSVGYSKDRYKGLYLLDAIDSLRPPTREFSKPLLMPICDIIKSTTSGQVSACDKLEAGALQVGSKVLVMPSAISGTVPTLERDSKACTIARAGDNVAVTLNGIDTSHVMQGGVLCHPDFPIKVASHLELKMIVLEGANPILVGSQLEFHIHHAKELAVVSKIVSVIDPKTGKVTKKSPRCLIAKQSAIIEVTLQEPVCVVESSNCKALGRVSLRASGRTIGVGLVTQMIQEQ